MAICRPQSPSHLSVSELLQVNNLVLLLHSTTDRQPQQSAIHSPSFLQRLLFTLSR